MSHKKRNPSHLVSTIKKELVHSVFVNRLFNNSGQKQPHCIQYFHRLRKLPHIHVIINTSGSKLKVKVCRISTKNQQWVIGSIHDLRVKLWTGSQD